MARHRKPKAFQVVSADYYASMVDGILNHVLRSLFRAVFNLKAPRRKRARW